MSRRSIGYRNFLGGFFGGVLGVLFAGNFNSPAQVLYLSFGVILGVLLGWYHQEMYAACENSLRRLHVRLQSIAATLGRSQKAPWGLARARALCGVGVEILSSSYRQVADPGYRAYRKFRDSPVRQTLVVRMLGFVTLALLCVYLVIWFSPRYVLIDTDATLIEIVMASCMSWFLLTLTAFFVLVAKYPLTADRSTQFYANFRDPILASRRLARFGLLGSFFWDVCNFVSTLRTCIAMALYVVFGLIGLFAMMLFLVLPTIGFSASVQGLHLLLNRRGHWFCLCVTFSVTILSVLTFAANPGTVQHWILALFAGTISGGLSELGARAFLRILQTSVVQRNVLSDTPLRVGFNIADAIGDRSKLIFVPLIQRLAGC